MIADTIVSMQENLRNAYDSVENKGGKLESKNLFDGNWEYGQWSIRDGKKGPSTQTDRIRCLDYIRVDSNTTYTLSFEIPGESYLVEYNANKEFLTYKKPIDRTTFGTFTTTSNTKYLTYYFIPTTQPPSFETKSQLEKGSVATDYEPYELPKNLSNLSKAIENIPTIPSIYQEVEYIESTGEQYIDTGFKPNQNTSFKIKFELITGSSEAATRFFETRNNSTSVINSFGLINFADYNNLFQYRYNTSFAKSDFHLNNDIWYEVKTDKNKVYLDNELIITASSSDFQVNYNLILFKFNSPNGIEGGSKYRISSFELYDNQNKVRDFIPCYNKETNEIGLYDNVYGVFYGNQGTGEFLKGKDI